MKRKRRAWFRSVVSLVLCISMLMGTTFAWFTDSETSSNNIISSGILDVKMEYTDDIEPDSGSVKWKDASTGAIFSYQLWEPGYTDMKYVKISNEGNLAFRYQLNIIPNTMPKAGEVNLAEVIDVYYGMVDSGFTVPSEFSTTMPGMIKLGTLSELLGNTSGTANGILLPDADKKAPHTELPTGVTAPEGDVTVCLMLHMQETAGNEYQNVEVGDGFSVQLLATQYTYEKDSFDNMFDKDSVFPDVDLPYTKSAAVKTDANNTVSEKVLISGIQANAEIPAGVLLEENTETVTLSISYVDQSQSNVNLQENEVLQAIDVHIDGVAEDNAVPMTITLKRFAPTGLNIGNLSMYHVEDGTTITMTRVDSDADFTSKDQFKYDPETGDVVLYMAGFSEVDAVADTEKKWEGAIDTTWYNTTDKSFIIANADQLAGLGQIVGGMATGIEIDSFNEKTVKLISDINLGDSENANNPNKIFYPIGYYYTDDNNEDGTKGDYYSTVSSFEGTFDGNGHTISNFYQNTWEIKGDYDGNYYKDAMGLFGYVVNGTVKNLTVDHFSSDGEFTPTGVIAAYAVNSTFENIAITNCNPRVYNTGNGGIVGIGGNADDPDTYKLIFKNITIDNSNIITALWGSWDVACGGLVGMFRGAGHVYMTNCHVAAQMDVYNDVCGNYQYYWYRYSGMMVGTNKNMTTDANGYTVPETDKYHAENCTVHFGDWNDYYYCELVANSLASYTHDHQFSRLTEISSLDEIKSGDTWTKTGNFLLNDGDTKTCYHIVKNSDGTLKQHLHTDAGEETVDGKNVLKEDKQIVYLPFNQLFTGYGWGVKHIPVYNGDDYAFEGIKILDREVANSVDKFEEADGLAESFAAGTEYAIGTFFKEKEDLKLSIDNSKVQAFVSPVEDGKMIYAEYVANEEDWTKGTLKFYGNGKAKITITDYYYCNPFIIEVDIIGNDTLYRVGNQNPVEYKQISKLLTGKESYSSIEIKESENCKVNFELQTGTVKFNDTGIVSVEINGVQYVLEIVEATNVAELSGTITGNVVLLDNCNISSLTVSGRNTVYGNGFTCSYTGNGQYLNNGLKQGVVTVSENGKLDNLRIVASIYPAAYLYYGYNQYAEYVQGGPSSSDGDRTRYHYQLSAVAASGNATISNCYIYGGRNNIFVNTGDVTIEDTVLECGTLANVQIQSNSSHTISFKNLTTIQHQVNSTIGDTSKVMLGAGVIVGPETSENPTIVLDGTFKQYNWVNENDVESVANKSAEMIIDAALNATAYNHTINGKTASNLGIIYMNTYENNIKNNTGLPYVLSDVSISGATGRVYSLQNATADQIYSDHTNADRSTTNGLYQPQFMYDENLGGQYIAKTEDGDEFCYREGDTIKVMFSNGYTKELDLASLVDIEKYSGQNLNLKITCKDSNGNNITLSDNKITMSEAKDYTVTYTVTDEIFFDKDGNAVNKTPINYSWNMEVKVTLKDTGTPDAYFEFDSTKQIMGYAKKSIFAGGQTQYLPFLAGLKIYDYKGQESYLRFDGDNDFNKIASATITGYTSANHVLIEVELTDGGVINIDTTARAASGGSTYTGKLQTSGNTLYYVNDGTTSATTTTWVISSYKFTGNSGVEVNSGSVTFSNCENGSVPTGSFSTTIKHTVKYDPNGGNCVQSVGYATSASAAVTLPTPTRSSYIFTGWYTAASGGTRVGGAGDSYTPSANITLYAQWGQPCTITYNANGGSCGVTSQKYTGTALILPEPTRDGYWFTGWYDAAEGGNKIGDKGASYNPSGEITLYAHWQESVNYTVTYDANGGTCDTSSATYEGNTLTLPTPTLTGYTFNGWHTAASGGTKIGDAGASYIPPANITLYAQWKINSYKITVSTSQATVSGVQNGQTAEYGATIFVTVAFSKNNDKTFTVTNDTTKETILNKSEADTYTFTMPASNVTISASSSGTCVTPDTLVTLADGTQKEVQHVNVGDEVMAWNFYTGEYENVPVSLLQAHDTGIQNVLHLYFDDGTELTILGEHGIFDADLKTFIFIDEDDVEEYLNHDFVKQDGDGFKTVKLVDYCVTTEFTTAYTILSADHYNVLLEDILTVTPAHVGDNFFNPFDIEEDMKYDESEVQADIEKYGLYTYEDFVHVLTYEQFVALNLAHFKVSVGKGYVTYEGLIYLIEHFVNNEDFNV